MMSMQPPGTIPKKMSALQSGDLIVNELQMVFCVKSVDELARCVHVLSVRDEVECWVHVLDDTPFWVLPS